MEFIICVASDWCLLCEQQRRLCFGCWRQKQVFQNLLWATQTMWCR